MVIVRRTEIWIRDSFTFVFKNAFEQKTNKICHIRQLWKFGERKISFAGAYLEDPLGIFKKKICETLLAELHNSFW